MNPDRFRDLLDAYGGDENHWPPEQRAAMRSLYTGDEDARAAVQRARDLDVLLNSYRVAVPDLAQQIVERVAPTPLGRFLAWLLPSAPTQWWRPATAFALPLLLGVAMGLSDTQNAAAASTVIDWELQEQDLLLAVSEEPWYE